MTKEPLDFCRVKKIHERGFGFLQSLHYDEDVFIHFSKISDPEVKESLEKMERGKIYLYFTSRRQESKRKADKVWMNLKKVPPELIDDFVNRITREFYDGKTNPYELAHVVEEMIKYGIADENALAKILASPKITRIPVICKAFIPEKNRNHEEINKIIEEAESKERFTKKARKEIIKLLLQ